MLACLWQNSRRTKKTVDPSHVPFSIPEGQKSERSRAAWVRGELLLIDVRRFTPALVRPFLTDLIDGLVAMDARDDIVIVCDYEPSGLAYQLDMRPETRGLFHYECELRSDGAWIETIRRV